MNATDDAAAHPGAPSRERRQLLPAWLPHVLLLGVLALAFAWAWHDMVPGLVGHYNDDATYVCFAKALAEGRGYVIPWSFHPILSERFPIGFPLLLAAVYRLVPGSLEHRIWGMQIAVNLMASGFLACSYLLMVKRLRVSPWAALVGVGLVVLNPFYPDLASSTMSDLPFGLLFVAAWWLQMRYLERQSAGRLVPAAVTVASAILIRYAAAILPVVVLGMLWRRGQLKCGLAYSLAVAASLAPWAVWVLGHRLFGYASQYAHTGATPGLFLASIAFSGLYLAYLGLATFLFPQVFLRQFPDRTPILFQNPAYMGLGLLATLFLLAGLAQSSGQQAAPAGGSLEASDRRFAALSIAAYLGLLWVWVAGFLNLDEFLTVRLLLPVTPVLTALALEAWIEKARRWRPAPRTVAAVFVTAMLLLGMTGAVQLHRKIAAGIARRQQNLESLVALMRAFTRQVPQSLAVATSLEPIFYLYTGRQSYDASPNPQVMMADLIQLPIHFLLLVPVVVSGQDLSTELVRTLNSMRPGLVITVGWDTGRPTGVFRIDRAKLSTP